MNSDVPDDADIPSETGIRADAGRREFFDALFNRVYAQLRAMAKEQMAGERPAHTLHATELVHQAYLRLNGRSLIDWASEGQFVRAAAEAMRRILVEHARGRGRLKRGGDRQRIPVELADLAADTAPLAEDCEQLVALDDALRRMEEKDPRAADVVRLRFFAGLTVEQTADTMKLSPRTVKREWEFARAWLAKCLQ